MNIFHVSAECYPIAKVGGLADVVGALPKYQKQLQNQVKVVLPAYQTPYVKNQKFKSVFKGETYLGSQKLDYSVEALQSKDLGFDLFLIKVGDFFDTANVYQFPADVERFLAFQVSFLNWIFETNQTPDVLHVHDHHTGLIPFLVKHAKAYAPKMAGIPTFLTIHNAQYHGDFGFDKLYMLPEFDHFKIGLLEWNGRINPLATAIKCAWKVSTVSPSYLEEMSIAANGLEDLLRSERSKSTGILNGIDTDVWDPQTDTYLEHRYSPRNVSKGKEANKKQLCETYEFDPNKPLFAFIGRLVGEKGADLLPHAISIALNKFKGDINILILGSGDPVVENRLKDLIPFYKSAYNAHIGYDEKLSHLIYAGADFLLMPSRVEPCGLNQMYALRYGTVPIVRRTGGLRDTVIDIGDEGFGICHDQGSVDDIVYSIGRAFGMYKDKNYMNKVIKMGMKRNNSWEKSAEAYIKVYQELIKMTGDVW
jgi:starch synthase